MVYDTSHWVSGRLYHHMLDVCLMTWGGRYDMCWKEGEEEGREGGREEEIKYTSSMDIH